MIKTAKIRLKPTQEQEILFWKSAGVARWAYNYFLSENERVYKEYLDNGKLERKALVKVKSANTSTMFLNQQRIHG